VLKFTSLVSTITHCHHSDPTLTSHCNFVTKALIALLNKTPAEAHVIQLNVLKIHLKQSVSHAQCKSEMADSCHINNGNMAISLQLFR